MAKKGQKYFAGLKKGERYLSWENTATRLSPGSAHSFSVQREAIRRLIFGV